MTHVFGSEIETKIVLTSGSETIRLVIRDRAPDGGPSTAFVQFVDKTGAPTPRPPGITLFDMSRGDMDSDFIIEAGCMYALMRGKECIMLIEQESRAVARAGTGWTAW